MLTADVRDAEAVRAALGDNEFDVVVDFLAFTPEHVAGRHRAVSPAATGQYVFISSASAYQKPPARLPVTESTPLRNPYWQYSRDKIACEDLLVAAYRETGFPVTIVRPSHTYDHTLGAARRRAGPRSPGCAAGAPVVVHGDGTSLWTLTHHTDFARAFVGLLANPHAVGDAFHITSDEALPWDQIAELLAAAAGVRAPDRARPVGRDRRASTRSGAPGCSATRRTRWSSTTARSRPSCPGWVATVPFAAGRPRDRRVARRRPGAAGRRPGSWTRRWTGWSRRTRPPEPA